MEKKQFDSVDEFAAAVASGEYKNPTEELMKVLVPYMDDDALEKALEIYKDDKNLLAILNEEKDNRNKPCKTCHL